MVWDLKFEIGSSRLEGAVVFDDHNLKRNLSTLLSDVYDCANSGRGLVGMDIVMESNSSCINRLMLSTANQCLIVHLADFEHFPAPLASFLQLPDVSLVGVSMKWCTDAIEKGYGVRCRNAVDLGAVAADAKGDPSLRWCGLLGLVDRVCGIVFTPRVDNRDVDNFCVSNAVHAYLCFLVGSRLLCGGSEKESEERNTWILKNLGLMLRTRLG